MDDFDMLIGQAKKIVGTSRSIAADVYPNGATLKCSRCGAERRASKADCARYFSTGWPTHCGMTMSAGALAGEA